MRMKREKNGEDRMNKILIKLRNKIKRLPPQCSRPLFDKYPCPIISNEADCVLDCENEIVWVCSFYRETYKPIKGVEW